MLASALVGGREDEIRHCVSHIRLHQRTELGGCQNPFVEDNYTGTASNPDTTTTISVSIPHAFVPICQSGLGHPSVRTQCRQQGGGPCSEEREEQRPGEGHRPRASCPPRRSRVGFPWVQTLSRAALYRRSGRVIGGTTRSRNGWRGNPKMFEREGGNGK